jgi:nitrogen fixation protein NifM
MIDQSQSMLNYYLLRASLLRFGKPPSQLDSDALNTIQVQAQREYSVEQRVLSSPEAASIHITDYEINRAIATIQARYNDTTGMVHDMEEHGIYYQDLRNAITRELKAEAILNHISSHAADISDLDVQLAYHFHLEQFRRHELRVVRHILLTINPDFPENTRAETEHRITKIAKRLQQKPHRFAEQAQKHSECPTAMNGGLLGQVPREQLYPELDNILFTMKEGEVSDPIESPIGLHVLYCESIMPAGLIPFKEAEPLIRKRLEDRARRQCQRAWLKKLRNQ